MPPTTPKITDLAASDLDSMHLSGETTAQGLIAHRPSSMMVRVQTSIFVHNLILCTTQYIYVLLGG